MKNKIGIYSALTSFLIGTILMLIFYFTGSNDIIGISLYFIGIAGFVNFGILLVLIIDILTEKENRKKNLRTSGIILLNVPVIILYFYFAMFLLSIMRITFINETEKIITDLKIIGGELKTINELEIGEKKTEWISIISGNDLVLEYKIGGEIKTEMVYSYMITGKKFKHRIGNDTNQINQTN